MLGDIRVEDRSRYMPDISDMPPAAGTFFIEDSSFRKAQSVFPIFDMA